MKWPMWVGVLLMVSLMASAQAPKLSSYVTDNAGVLSPQFQAALEDALRALEEETNSVQFVVFIEKSVPQDSTLEERTLRIAEKNGIGKEENDNGILLYIASEDREYRWEVGYGIEGTLSASWLGRMSREVLNPAFAEGNYGKGILDSVSAIHEKLMRSGDADIAKGAEEESMISPRLALAIILIAFLMIIVISIIAAKASTRQGITKKKGSWEEGVYTGAATGIFWPRGGGGFGGGGFGGFSGGGGGFGGGGFSGKF